MRSSLLAVVLMFAGVGGAQAHLPAGEICRAHNLGIDIDIVHDGSLWFVWGAGHGSCERHMIVNDQSTMYLRQGSGWHVATRMCESRECGTPEYYAESWVGITCSPLIGATFTYRNQVYGAAQYTWQGINQKLTIHWADVSSFCGISPLAE